MLIEYDKYKIAEKKFNETFVRKRLFHKYEPSTKTRKEPKLVGRMCHM